MASHHDAAHRTPQWRDAVAGACAGAVSRTVMAPVERIKLLKQLSPHGSPHTSTASSSFQIANTIYKEQGMAAFWRGNLPSAMRVSGTAAINFTSMEYYKTTIVAPMIASTQLPHAAFWTSLISGGMAGATATTILYPMEFLRTRLAMDMGGSSTQQRQYHGMRDVLTKIVRSDGIVGLFQGYGIALVGGIVYRIILLGGYDALKDELRRRNTDSQLSWMERIVSAQVISLTAGTIAYPFDSVRRRMMMQAGSHQRMYRNSWHCIRIVWEMEGTKGFFLGLAPNIVRSMGGALLLVSYDRVRSWI